MARTGLFVIAFYPDGCPYSLGPYDTHEKRRSVASRVKEQGRQVIEVDVGSWESKPTIHVGNPGYIEPIKEDEDG
jgi:hypothetical protein